MSRAPVLGMLLKGYPRISETFISGEIRHLERLGFRVRIISMRAPRENFTHESVKDIRAEVDYLPSELLPGIPRLLPPFIARCFHAPRRTLAGLGLMLRRLARSRRVATLKHLLQAAYIAEKILPGSGITHLHAHFAHSPASVAMFTSVLTGLPFSFTGHAKDVWTQDPRQLAEKIAAARFVVTCTEANRVYLEGLAAGATAVHRVYHGIDLAHFSANGHRPPQPPYRLITVARLTPKKGLPTVVRALAMLRERGVPFTWTLIGEGEDRERVIGLIDELGLRDVTQWLGVQPHDVVLERYRISDVFVIGCEVQKNGDRDGIPNVLAESLAMGVPVVATNVSAIPELIEDGECGLLVPPGDPAAMADAIERMLTDESLRGRMVEQGKARVREVFDSERCTRELAGIYTRETGIRTS